MVTLHHTGLVVSDLEAAIEFYTLGIGLEVVDRYGRSGEGVSSVVGYEAVELTSCLLTDSSGRRCLELIQYLNPEPNGRMPPDRNKLGSSHCGFEVLDMGHVLERLASFGVEPINAPALLTPNRIACYLADPDGNWFELFQAID